MRPADAVLQKFRDLCLSLPETSEVGSWGHPNFRAGKRTFATFEWIGDRPSIAFRLNTTDINLLLRRNEFFVTPYGRGQWVSIWADAPLDWRFVGDLLRRSYRVVALKRMISALEGNCEGEWPANNALQPPPPSAVPSARKRRSPRRG
jgi:predicted DNA-binding protein (MmcQ/YjbR family)